MAMKLLGSDARPAFALPFSEMSQQIQLQQLDMAMLQDDLKLILKPVYGE
jgi:diaminohydroxyphosphoribosylaminopyrimidine deaminase/5-amino-6-(5-phosphoribosylamino)uracil reductase